MSARENNRLGCLMAMNMPPGSRMAIYDSMHPAARSALDNAPYKLCEFCFEERFRDLTIGRAQLSHSAAAGKAAQDMVDAIRAAS